MQGCLSTATGAQSAVWLHRLDRLLRFIAPQSACRMRWRAASFEVFCTVGDVSVQQEGQQGCTCGVARRMEERCFLGSIGKSPIDTLSSSSCSEGNQTAVSHCAHVHCTGSTVAGESMLPFGSVLRRVQALKHAAVRPCLIDQVLLFCRHLSDVSAQLGSVGNAHAVCSWWCCAHHIWAVKAGVSGPEQMHAPHGPA